MRDEATAPCYGYVGQQFLQLRPTKGSAQAQVVNINEQFRALVLSHDFPCVMAKSVVRTNRYWLALYDELGSTIDARRNRQDLYEYNSEFPESRDPAEFASFVSVFRSPSFGAEVEFERQLWTHLQAMHDEDRLEYTWDPTVSRDPENPHFSFSVGGRAYYIVGTSGTS